MSWYYRFQIAGLTVQVDSDSAACQQDMLKFLKLYKQTSQQTSDLKFSVCKKDDGYHFMFLGHEGKQDPLWFSGDEREVTAALEIHLYSKIIQYLDTLNVSSIHSAVLNVHDQAVMFAGVSGAGKSSICTAGLLAGAGYLSDEFSLLDERGDIHPFPRPMQWEHETHPAFDRNKIEKTGLIKADYFDFPAATGDLARCNLWHPKNIQEKPLRLTIVVLHQFQEGLKQVELTEIPRHEALLELPQHLHVQRGLAKDFPMLNQKVNQGCRFYR